MKIEKGFYILICLVVFTGPAFGQESLRKMVFCRNGKAVRTLRVEPDSRDKSGWVTYYTKGGRDEIVGEGLNPKSCDDVADRVRKTLESNNWKCRDVDGAQVAKSSLGQ